MEKTIELPEYLLLMKTCIDNAINTYVKDGSESVLSEIKQIVTLGTQALEKCGDTVKKPFFKDFKICRKCSGWGYVYDPYDGDESVVCQDCQGTGCISRYSRSI